MLLRRHLGPLAPLLAWLTLGSASFLGCQTNKSAPPAGRPAEPQTASRPAPSSPPSAPEGSSSASGRDSRATPPANRNDPDSALHPWEVGASAALSGRKAFAGQVSWGVGADASGPQGVVSSVENAATEVGVAILERGGNAVDAAIATAFALAVTHPSAGNIGGGGFMLLRRGDRIEAIDFREDSPAGLDIEQFWKMIADGGHGAHSVGVPGTVAGLYLAHQRHGKIPWAQLVLPAEELARKGYVLGVRQARTLVWGRQYLLESPVAREAFFVGTTPKKAGARIKRPRLAVALQRIRERGLDGFYQGPTAQDLVQSVGGAIQLGDLHNYRARLRDPLYFDFGAHRVVTMPSPSGGGIALAAQLRMLDAISVQATRRESPTRYHFIAEASRRAQVERQLFVVSPDVLTPEEQKHMRDRALDPMTWLGPHPIDPHHASKSADLDPTYPKLAKESEQTTHVSVIDQAGNLVSLTLTLSASYGSHLFTNETGIVLNNSVASFAAYGKNTPAPSQRTVSSMAPTLVFLGPHALVLGSPGGDTIPSTLCQIFLRLTLDGQSLAQAVRSPRFHQGFVPQELGMERYAPLPIGVQNELGRMGHDPKWARGTQGDANIAALVDSTAHAVFDRREGGLALAARSGQGQGQE